MAASSDETAAALAARGPGTSGVPWEVLQGALQATATATACIAYGILMWLMATHADNPRWDLYASPLLLATGGIAIRAWALPYRARASFFLVVLFASILVGDLASGAPQTQLLYAFVCLTAGLLLGPVPATLEAGLAAAAVAVRGWPLDAHPGACWALGALGLALTLVWVGLGQLVLAVQRTQADEAYAWRKASEARLRRAELVRARKALDEMYALLQRTNHELAVARGQAEEARQIKAQFAASISHELRTPLNLIMGFSEIMYRSPEVYGNMQWSPALRADIREIHHASGHLLGMIDDILNLSRIEAQRLPLRLEATDVGELIREAVATSRGLLRGKDIALEVSLPQALPAALVDRTRIRQVLLNLLNNAIRFTDRGRIEVTATAAGGEVTVAVADTGVGIPADELEAIFEEFHQARGPITSGRGGAGLGLAICKQFARLHGGRIEAQSEVGRGSVFRFTLPLPASGPAPAQLFYYAPEGWSPPVPENPLGKTAIVLAPDSSSGAMLASAIEGYRTLPVDTLASLAEKVEAEHPAGIVLVDRAGTDSPTEPEAVWKAAGRADLPLVRCHAPPVLGASQALGLAGFLVKPVQREQLVAAIGNISPTPESLLLVDDDAGFVALLQRMLGAEYPGTRVRTAYSGEEAMEALATEKLDLVVLDLIMSGTSGLEVIEAMRREARLAPVPIIVITGSGYGEEAAQAGPARVELLRSSCSQPELGRYITALLDAAPPDYSRPAPPAAPPTAAAERPAS